MSQGLVEFNQYGNDYFNVQRVPSPTQHQCGTTNYFGLFQMDADTDEEDYEEEEQPSPKPPPLRTISPASFNLRAYLKGAVLRPLVNHCKDKNLCIFFGGRGGSAGAGLLYIPSSRIEGSESIKRFTKKSFKDCIEFYHANGTTQPATYPRFRPCIGIYQDPLVKPYLTLPAFVNNVIISPEEVPLKPPCSCEIDSWLQYGPLRTAERALNLSHVYTSRWHFTKTAVPNILHSDFTIFVWKYQQPDPRSPDYALDPWIPKYMNSEQRAQAWMAQRLYVPDGKMSIAILVRPPWLLSLGDMENFTSCSQLPAFDPVIPPRRLRKTHRLWYAVRTACINLDTDYFIITTYEGWLFGRFGNENEILGKTLQDSFESYSTPKINLQTSINHLSSSSSTSDNCITDPRIGQRWSRCAVSAVYKYRARSPSIMEMLTYWVARSMGLKYTNAVPLVFYLPNNTRIQLRMSLDAAFTAPILSLVNIKPGVSFADLFTNVPFPKLPCGLEVPITRMDEQLNRRSADYLTDLKRFGIDWLSPQAAFMQLQVWLRDYYEKAALDMYPDLVSDELRDRINQLPPDHASKCFVPYPPVAVDWASETAEIYEHPVF